MKKCGDSLLCVVVAVLLLPAVSAEPAIAQACDDFSGSTINSSIWETVTGDWTQANDRLTGYWTLSDAHGEQGVILLQPGAVPAGDYTLDADMVVAPASVGNGHRLVLQNSIGNKFIIPMTLYVNNPSNSYATVQVKHNGGPYSDGIRFAPLDSIANFTPGSTNRLTLTRRGGTDFFCYFNGHFLFSFRDSIWAGDLRPGLGTYGYATYERVCTEIAAQPYVHMLFQDDFESYAVGATPGSPWSLAASGAGPEYQVVTDATSYSGTNCMRMRGSAPMYAADLCATFGPFVYDPVLGNCSVVLECAMKTPTVLGNDNDDAGMNICGGVGFQNYASQGAITMGSLCNLAPGRWYRLTTVAFPETQTSDVYVDSMLVGAKLPLGGCASWSSACLHAGWDLTDYYFDDVKIYWRDDLVWNSAVGGPAGVRADGIRLQYANPYVAHAPISLSAPSDQPVTVTLYDAAGRQIVRLAEGTPRQGRISFSWDGRSDSGIPTGSGMYFLDVRGVAGHARRGLVLIR